MRAPFQLGCRHYSHKLLLTNTVLAMFCHHFCPPASWASNPLEPSIHIQHCKMKHGKKNEICHPHFSQSRCHVLQAVFGTQNRFSRRPWVSQLLTMGSASMCSHQKNTHGKYFPRVRRISAKYVDAELSDMFFLTKMKLEEATGLCGARQHRWLRQGYEGINGTAEKMSKACPAKKNREVTQKKRNLGKLKFLTLAMAQKQVPID